MNSLTEFSFHYMIDSLNMRYKEISNLMSKPTNLNKGIKKYKESIESTYPMIRLKQLRLDGMNMIIDLCSKDTHSDILHTLSVELYKSLDNDNGNSVFFGLKSRKSIANNIIKNLNLSDYQGNLIKHKYDIIRVDSRIM
uniref:Uncharacterized protein n=1 Tax=viral metagenome TaxID=1070528 RepID=A0A6C0LHM1_9ZZZZ